MSVAVGLVDKGDVWIGADSIAAGDDSMTIRKDPKVWRRDDMLLGFGGSWRMAQILRYSLVPPKRKRSADPHQYLATDFAQAAFDALKAHHYWPGGEPKDGEDPLGGDLLIGYQGRLFQLACDFHVAESLQGYEAIGVGDALALGALHQQELFLAEQRRLKRTDGLDARNRVLDALKCAERGCPKVAKPFVVMRLEKR
jgi:hypothetical protein